MTEPVPEAHQAPFRDRWAVAFGAIALAAALALLWLGLGMTFFSDEWAFIEQRSLGDPASWFAPHNEHWVTFPVLLYRAVVETIGIGSYVPFHLVLIVLHLAVASLVYRLTDALCGSAVRPHRRHDRAVPGWRVRELVLGVPDLVRRLDPARPSRHGGHGRACTTGQSVAGRGFPPRSPCHVRCRRRDGHRGRGRVACRPTVAALRLRATSSGRPTASTRTGIRLSLAAIGSYPAVRRGRPGDRAGRGGWRPPGSGPAGPVCGHRGRRDPASAAAALTACRRDRRRHRRPVRSRGPDPGPSLRWAGRVHPLPLLPGRSRDRRGGRAGPGHQAHVRRTQAPVHDRRPRRLGHDGTDPERAAAGGRAGTVPCSRGHDPSTCHSRAGTPTARGRSRRDRSFWSRRPIPCQRIVAQYGDPRTDRLVPGSVRPIPPEVLAEARRRLVEGAPVP